MLQAHARRLRHGHELFWVGGWFCTLCELRRALLPKRREGRCSGLQAAQQPPPGPVVGGGERSGLARRRICGKLLASGGRAGPLFLSPVEGALRAPRSVERDTPAEPGRGAARDAGRG